MFDALQGLLFIHIPKCGGESIQTAMGTAMKVRYGELMRDSKKQRMPPYYSVPWLTQSARNPHESPGGRYINEANLVNDTHPCSYERMVTMDKMNTNPVHFTETMSIEALRKCYNYGEGIRSFAVVREPLQRLVSGWKWLRRMGQFTGSFRQWIHKADNHLFKQRQIEYIGPCTLVFALETNQVWHFLKEQYPSIQPKHLNTAQLNQTDVDMIAPSTAAEVRRLYREDYAIWSTAIASARKSLSEMEPACYGWSPVKASDSAKKALMWSKQETADKKRTYRAAKIGGKRRLRRDDHLIR